MKSKRRIDAREPALAKRLVATLEEQFAEVHGWRWRSGRTCGGLGMEINAPTQKPFSDGPDYQKSWRAEGRLP